MVEINESQIITDGQALGLSDKELIDYVEKRIKREEKARDDNLDRDARKVEREYRRLETEAELENKRL